MTTAAVGPDPHCAASPPLSTAVSQLGRFGITVTWGTVEGGILDWDGPARTVTLDADLDPEEQAIALDFALRRARGGRHAVAEFVPRRHLRAV